LTKIRNEKKKKKILPEADFKTLSGNVEKRNLSAGRFERISIITEKVKLLLLLGKENEEREERQ
jgi:hypothetical protein